MAKFDFARGYGFSTYASRVIMRGLGHQKDRDRGAISLTAEEHLDQQSCEPAALLQKLEVPETWKKLDDREKEVIAMRFGLFGENRRTLKQIGERMGISKERVRQLESRALGKLGRKASQNLPPREAPQNAHESHEATCRETTEAAGVQATAEELDKYREYVVLMKDHNLDPRSLDAWLENYRARSSP